MSSGLDGFGGGERIFVKFVAGAETGEEDFDWFCGGCCGRLRFGDQFLCEVEDFDRGGEIRDEESGGSSSVAAARIRFVASSNGMK